MHKQWHGFTYITSVLYLNIVAQLKNIIQSPNMVTCIIIILDIFALDMPRLPGLKSSPNIQPKMFKCEN